MNLSVGVIGLGAMGNNAALRLDEVGFAPIVFDIRPESVEAYPPEQRATSVADLASRADVILAFLPYSEQVEAVALGDDGVLHHAKPGTIFVNMGTVAASAIQKIAAGLEPAGVEVVGAPMNGGPHLARSGELQLVVGGKDAAVEVCRPVIASLGFVRHVGGVGAGEVVKIVNNLILAICINANAEALTLGVKFGIDPDVLVDAVVHGVGSNHGMRKHYQGHVLKGDFGEDGLFSVDYMRKDLKLAFDLGNELKVPLHFGAMADQNYQAVRAKGRERNYHPVVCTLMEELCGVEIRSRK